jgi:hypothetical protein
MEGEMMTSLDAPLRPAFRLRTELVDECPLPPTDAGRMQDPRGTDLPHEADAAE